MIYKTKLYILFLFLSLFTCHIYSSGNNINLDGFLKLNQNENVLKINKLNQNYDQQHIIDFIEISNYEKSLKRIVKENENNIVAISYGYGLPISSGLLLNDHYVLTLSNIANDEHFNELSVRLGYQKAKAINYNTQNVTILMDYGKLVEIDGIVEINNDIGYSILKLSNGNNIINSKKIKLSKRIQKENQLNILFNFENGGPKQISIVKIGDSLHLRHASNGVYFDDRGKFIGLLGETGNFISARDIELNSKYLNKIINNDDIKIEKRIRHHHRGNPNHHYSSSKRPRYPGPNLPNPHTPPLARHHIIPYGLMEALWQLSSEYTKIKELFFVINKQPTLQYVVWSYYNIFAGPNPSLRYHKDELERIFGEGTLGYDPEDSVEPLKPRSFNSKQWNIMQDLNKLLVSTYQHRSNILSSTSKSNQKVILQTSLKSYQDKLEQIFNLLNENKYLLGKIEGLHDYDESDWVKLEKKYYLLS